MGSGGKRSVLAPFLALSEVCKTSHMAEPKRSDLRLRAERAVLVQVVTPRGNYNPDETFQELESLARTAGANVVGHLRQKRSKHDPTHYLGTGKVRELKALVASSEADVVICDDELNPAQVKRLESALDTKVVDRSEVILDIFAGHARTNQAKLQVELAQLEYEFPRLKRMWTHLDRTAGGTLGGPAGGGIGVRGPGERQLEVDRRLVQRRIYDLRRRLQKIEDRRRNTVEARSGQFRSVALVGYTNAGKSSLMNALTGSRVAVRDRLFETLDTRTREWELPDGPSVLLSDTVGFIRKFPHHLAASFHATLEEAHEADLLLHVIDASRHDSEQEIEAVNDALRQIDCDQKPTLYVLNKIDLLDDLSEVPLLRGLVGDVVCTSVETGRGVDELTRFVQQRFNADCSELRVSTGAGNGRLIAFLHENAQVLQQSVDDTTMQLRVRVAPAMVGVIRHMGGRVEALPAGTGA